jgi:dTDP-4-amino-4,6-dideoxygalactose transaminase
VPDWRVPLADVRFSEDEVQAVADVYRSGWLSQGPRVRAFEAEFARWLGAEQAVAVSSGTAALHLALVAAGVSAGDEVIVPSLTFAATAAAVVAAGANPVFADVQSARAPWLSVAAVEAAVTARTRAVINVAYAGLAGEVVALRRVADERGLFLLEDAAHAVGGRTGDGATGTIGHAGAFSFFANKNLPLGEGGMLVTADADLAARARLLRSHGLSSGTWARHQGQSVDYEVLEPGFNYRLDEARAALGSRLLQRIDADNAARSRLATRYRAALRAVATPVIGDAPGCAWHIYPVLLEAAVDRAAFRERLAAAGVQTSVHYPPLHLSPAFARHAGAALPATEAYARRTVTLPLFAHMTESQQDLVIGAVLAA